MFQPEILLVVRKDWTFPEPSLGLIMVFDAILTSRQNGQKLQCLYGNPMTNNVF